MQIRVVLLVFLIGAVAAGCAGGGIGAFPTVTPVITLLPGHIPTSSFSDPVLAAGQNSYNLICAHCHGYNGEGQLASTIETSRQLGMDIVPPQNSSGHTWEHPDQLLVRVIKEGIQNPLAQYPMPAFGDSLIDDDIHAILAYIKLWWTDEQRAHQARLTENWAELDRQYGVGGE